MRSCHGSHCDPDAPQQLTVIEAEVVVSGHVEPILRHGGATVKALSAAFLADLESHWRTHWRKVLDVLLYFGGIVRRQSLARVKDDARGNGRLGPAEIVAR
jgi:hypothetical protein